MESAASERVTESRSSGLVVGVFSAFLAQFLLHTAVLTEMNNASPRFVFGFGALLLLALGVVVLSRSVKAGRASSEPPWKMGTLAGWGVLGYALTTLVSTLIYAVSVTTGDYLGFVLFWVGIFGSGIGAVILAILVLLLRQFNHRRDSADES